MRFLERVGEPVEHLKKEKTEISMSKEPRVLSPIIWPESMRTEERKKQWRSWNR